MDDKIIRQYGNDILCYRLRTVRQKKRAVYDHFHKQLIQLHKEERELYRQRRELPFVPLEPPVQKGWVRHFVLREDVARSPQAEFFTGILAKINTKHWSYRKEFKIRKRKAGKKIYVVKGQELLKPDACHFARPNFSDAEKQFFYADHYLQKGINRFGVRYVFTEPWRFVLRVRPNIIDKVKARDEALEARLNEINSYLKRTAYRAIQTKLLDGKCGWSYYKREEKRKERNPLKNKPLHCILDEIRNENLYH